MSNNPPAPRTQDFFASPALSLSLAGIFRGANERQEGGGGGGSSNEVVEEAGSSARREETVEMSSENSGLVRSRSDDDDVMEGGDDDDEDDDESNKKKKKRKKYHRHTAEQIREMEALFKESPHPDEKQRQQLSKQLGLASRQVKFWFQNRRTQIKAIQERHENSLLKSEMDKLRDENKSMREIIKKSCCTNCGNATTRKDTSIKSEEQQLRIENATLKSEVEKLRESLAKFQQGYELKEQENLSTTLVSQSVKNDLEKSRISEIMEIAVNEVIKMANAGEPLWIKSIETVREILNYDEYVKVFCHDQSTGGSKRSIEVSRDTGVAFVDLPKLVQCFMDTDQWKEMFPNIISKATNVELICNGEGPNKNGEIQLIFAELQMLTPTIPTREVYFARICKKLTTDQWAIVDVSIDKLNDKIDASMAKCRKRPSGCIIEDKANGHCKITWVEHWECNKTSIHSIYRTVANNGIAFGAKHWISSLQQQCERLVFFMATNVPTKDSSGVTTLAGRKSVLKLAERMSRNFIRSIGATSYNTWNKAATKNGDDVRICIRKNLNEIGEPLGLIICAASSIWLPVSARTLFDFLRDETQRNQWDIMSNAGPVQSVANLSKGQNRGNSVTIQAVKLRDNAAAADDDNTKWILQDSATNAYESMVIYSKVKINEMESVMTGVDSSNLEVLPSGFWIVSDGLESRSLLISSSDDQKSCECGCLVTFAVQKVAESLSTSGEMSAECVEFVSTMILSTLRNVKSSLKCEDS